MRILLFLCLVAFSGCVSQDVRVPQLQYEVRALKEDVTEMSKKLDKTSKTATAAKATASKNAVKVEDVKRVAEKAAEPKTFESPMPPSSGPSVIIKPREINHETSLFPE